MRSSTKMYSRWLEVYRSNRPTGLFMSSGFEYFEQNALRKVLSIKLIAAAGAIL
jgi:hypothetical protein